MNMNMASPDTLVISTVAGALLAGLLTVATWSDLRERRVPNALVLAGVATGLMLNAFAPSGSGFFSVLRPGGLGFLTAGAGLFAGAALLLPLYLIHGMGAGDVKLMGMVGAFVGPLSVIDVALLTLVAGGVLAGAVAFWNGTLSRAAENIRFMMIDSVTRGFCGQRIELAAAHQCAGNVPYALAIACGTLLHLLFVGNGYSLFAH